MSLKWRHAGQACITANRVYVQSGIYDKFAQLLAEQTKKLVVGHGADKSTTMGPVTTPQSLDRALAQVEDAKKNGGNILLGGGKVKNTEGFFFEPTIILDANTNMKITHEETFAPVLALYKFKDEDEVVELANNTSVSMKGCDLPHKISTECITQMGLASYFFTKNVDRTWRLLENLEAGMIGMNTGMSISS